MKAAVLTEFRKPLEIQTLPDPSPGPDDALIRVEGCGICRSDWHLWQEDWTWVGLELALPRIMGHEVSGVVEEVGKNVKNFKVGNRVTMAFHTACGHCSYCYSGHSNQCESGDGAVGVSFDGGYGQCTVIPKADINLVHLPENVDFLSASALGCRYMTAYHGIVDRIHVKPGEWLVVFGAGGVGLSAVQIASALGAQVIAVDINDEKLALAKAQGARTVVNAAKDDAVASIREVTQGGAHVSVDALGLPQTALPALNSLRRGGRHLQIGLTGKDEKGSMTLPLDALVFQEISVITSFGCPTTSYPGLLSLVDNGTLRPKSLISQTVVLEDVNDVLAAMTEFSTVGFNVITSW